ncbi:hypothetical protein DSO57_1039260, partial [Entomophthora muscae]
QTICCPLKAIWLALWHETMGSMPWPLTPPQASSLRDPFTHVKIVEDLSPSSGVSMIPRVGPDPTAWLAAGMLLMGLNAHLPQLSPTASLWRPV